jgi:hypothetical protein
MLARRPEAIVKRRNVDATPNLAYSTYAEPSPFVVILLQQN